MWQEAVTACGGTYVPVGVHLRAPEKGRHGGGEPSVPRRIRLGGITGEVRMIREITPVSGTFISPIMSEARGVEVTITFAGSVRNKKFPDRPHGPTDMEFGRTFVALDPDGHRLRVFAPAAA